jgi:hypothetical protein
MNTARILVAMMVVAAMAVCGVTPAKAQLNFGARVGWAISDLGQGNSEEYLAGPSASLMAEYYLPSSFGLRLGVGYARKGSSLIYGQLDPKENWSGFRPMPNAPVYMNAGLDYLDIPLQVRYKRSIDEKARLSVGLGGYLGYGLGGDMNVVYPDELLKSDAFNGTMHGIRPERSIKAFNRTDFGALIDVEFVYRHFAVGLDYRLGLHNVHDRLPVYPNATNATARNYTLNISVGYNFK